MDLGHSVDSHTLHDILHSCIYATYPVCTIVCKVSESLMHSIAKYHICILYPTNWYVQTESSRVMRHTATPCNTL